MVDEFLKIVGEKSSSNEEGRLVWNGGEETLYILDKTHSQNIKHLPVDSYKETFNLQLNEDDTVTREYNLIQDDTGTAILRKIRLRDVTQSQIIFESFVRYINNKTQKGIYTFKKHTDGYFFINDDGKEIITDLENTDCIDIDFYIPYLSYPFYVGIQTKVTANNPRIIFTNIDLTKNNKIIYNSVPVVDPSVTKICGSAHLKVGNFVYCFTLIQENFKTKPYKYTLMYFTNEAIPKLKKKELYATHNTSLSLSQIEESSYVLITRIAKLGQGSGLHFEKFRVREASLDKFGTLLTSEKVKADVPFEMANILTYTPVIKGYIYLTNKTYVVPVNNQFYDVKQIDSPPPFDVAISPLGHYIVSHPFIQKGKIHVFYETKEFIIKLKEDGTTIIIEKKNFLTLKKYAFERNLGIFEAGKKQIIYHHSDKECANPIYFTVPNSAESLINILSINYNLVGGDTFYFIEKDTNGEVIENLKYLFDDLSGKFVNVMTWEKRKISEISQEVTQTTNTINNDIKPTIQTQGNNIDNLKGSIRDLRNEVTQTTDIINNDIKPTIQTQGKNIDDLKKRVTQTTDTIQTQGNDITTLNTRVTGITNTIYNDIKPTIQTQRSDINFLNTRVNGLIDTININIKPAIQTQGNDITTLKNKVNRVTDTIQIQGNDINGLKNSVNRITDTIYNDIKPAIQTQRRDINFLYNRVTETTETINNNIKPTIQTQGNDITTLKKIIKDLKNKVYKPIKGYIHIRFPGNPRPEKLFLDDEGKETTKEEEWIKLDDYYPGCFFRMSGGYASKFKKETFLITDYEENTSGSSGGQIDTLQEHQHVYWEYRNDFRTNSGLYDFIARDYAKKETLSTTGRTSYETRPKNITVEIYKYLPL